MISEFHGNDEKTHDAFQAWRRSHVNGFHMTESATGLFTIHWAQDRRETSTGRGCMHQGGSTVQYREDKNGCYTAARKICSEDLAEMIAWARDHNYRTKNCKHCDTPRFPFPPPRAP
jgi:hypothetical protein